MSTRAQIKYKDSEFNIHIYKHSDGHPEGVLPQLIPFVKEFFETRGDDECYFLTQLVRRSINDYILGWGLDCVEHSDIEYLYEVDNKGNIYVNGKKLTKNKTEKYLK